MPFAVLVAMVLADAAACAILVYALVEDWSGPALIAPVAVLIATTVLFALLLRKRSPNP